MRIIAGQRRGHKFDGPKGSGTRPTSDLVRESLFNILGELVADRIVIDLFAGTGALGLEALSRGAGRAIFVEQNRDNVALIRRNVATLRYEDRARAYHADAFRWSRAFVAVDEEPLVVFLDPPYSEYENHPQRVNQLLGHLIRKLPDASILVVESRKMLDEGILPELDTWDIRRYGGTQVALRAIARQERGADEPARPPAPDPPITTGGEVADAGR